MNKVTRVTVFALLSCVFLLLIVYACRKTDYSSSQPPVKNSLGGEQKESSKEGSFTEPANPAKRSIQLLSIEEQDSPRAQELAEWWNVLSGVCLAYANVTGEPPVSLQQMYDEGLLFCIPDNAVLNRPMDLANSTTKGDFYIKREDGGIFLVMDRGDDTLRHKFSSIDDDGIGFYEKVFSRNSDLESYYSDPTHLKLLMMMETIRMTITALGVSTPDELLSWHAWPLTPDGKNPVTGEPLEMGKGPGQYNLWKTEKSGSEFLAYTVYDEEGKSIQSPSITMKDPLTGIRWQAKWISYIPLEPDKMSPELKESLDKQFELSLQKIEEMKSG